MLISCAILVVLNIAAALLYHHTKKDSEKMPDDGLEHKPELLQRAWRFGLFDCFGDAKVTCLTCFFPALRWADTMRMAGFLRLWVAFGLFLCLYIGGALTASVFFLILLVILISYRQKQRKMFEMDHGTCGSYLEDCLTYSCCGCCAMIQEARHIEEAWAVAHPSLPAPISMWLRYGMRLLIDFVKDIEGKISTGWFRQHLQASSAGLPFVLHEVMQEM